MPVSPEKGVMMTGCGQAHHNPGKYGAADYQSLADHRWTASVRRLPSRSTTAGL